MPGMPFNQTFSFPHELTLRSTEDGIRMFAEPVKEIKALYGETHSIEDQELTEAKTADLAVSGDIFDIRATIEVGDANVVGLDISGDLPVE